MGGVGVEMTLEQSYAEKGLAVTQIQLWQQRLKAADEIINRHLAEQSKPKVDVVPNGVPG